MAMTRRDELSAQAGDSGDLLVGQGAVLEGKLTFKGTVRIDARFTGSIVTDDVLVVGEHARIEAEITCGTIVVDGEVNGSVKATTAVELHQGGRLLGSVETASLQVAKGAVLQGDVRMSDDGRGPKPVPPPGLAGR
jgi:cytoskeletal protein CcmA (bactofilin family)